MSTAIKTELRTLFSSKIILLMLAFLFAASLFYYWNSLNSAHDNILYYQDALRGFLQYSAEIGADEADSSSILDSLKNIFIVFHPKMVINTSLAIFLGMGMLVFPIISSCFMGMEYGQSRNIKQKVASYGSLFQIVCAKAIVLTLTLVTALVVFILLALVLANWRWGEIRNLLARTPGLLLDETSIFSVPQNIAIILCISLVLLFYSLLTLLLAGAFKGIHYGIIGVLAVNFITLPFRYAPHNVAVSLMNGVLFVRQEAPYHFTTVGAEPLRMQSALLVLLVYLAVELALLVIMSLRQRNA